MITLNEIPKESLKFKFVNASGPGGQHVNKASTAVELTVDLDSLNLPYPVMNRLKLKYSNRISKRRKLIVQVDNFRSQHQNRKEATAILIKILNDALRVSKKRIATSPTKSSQKKRLDRKKRRGVTKSGRKPPSIDQS